MVATMFCKTRTPRGETLQGNSQAPYLNWNDGERNLNANHADDDWNEHNRSLFVRNSISFFHSLRAGVFE
jgi:hypothetical protein